MSRVDINGHTVINVITDIVERTNVLLRYEVQRVTHTIEDSGVLVIFTTTHDRVWNHDPKPDHPTIMETLR